MKNNEDIFKKVISHSKEYGFVFQSSEIYDGLSAIYDYGPNGIELKLNLKKYWWDSMVRENENIVGLDSAILMHPKIWKASGHVDAFNDPLIDNKDSKKRYRADTLIENHIEKLISKKNKEIKKASKKFGEKFSEQKFISTNTRIIEYITKIDLIKEKFNSCLKSENLEGLKNLILDLKIVCPISGTSNWTDVRQFNLMFGTNFGSTNDIESKIWLRPETAQGIFVNFLNVQKSSRLKIPFGIAQIGKAFRNEIIARQFIFRMREFEQMEMQFFVQPGKEIKWFNKWKENRINWHYKLGIEKEKLRFHDHEKLAHYANAACDIEYDFPFGYKEIEGIHSRTNFDLESHSKLSGKKLKYFDSKLSKSYTPFVIETSIGLDRMFLLIMCNSIKEETLKDGEKRIYLKFPFNLSPVKLAILPLTKKNDLPIIARKIYDDLKTRYHCVIEEKDSIGKRYRRQDAIGTPFCITIDNESPHDNKVTIRNRDDMTQDRIYINSINNYINDKLIY